MSAGTYEAMEDLRLRLRVLGVPTTCVGPDLTFWMGDQGRCTAVALDDEKLEVHQTCTSRRAIAATVGPLLVFCRECKHYRDHEWIIATDVSDVCHFWGDGPVKVEPDGFCKWGERKEEA